jgi:hypothetical protein
MFGNFAQGAFALGMVRLLRRALLLPWFCETRERPIVIPLWALMIGLTFGPIIYFFGLKRGEMFDYVAGLGLIVGLILTFLLGGYGFGEHEIEQNFAELNELNPIKGDDSI